jgi:hypothetical protein
MRKESESERPYDLLRLKSEAILMHFGDFLLSLSLNDFRRRLVHLHDL